MKRKRNPVRSVVIQLQDSTPGTITSNGIYHSSDPLTAKVVRSIAPTGWYVGPAPRRV